MTKYVKYSAKADVVRRSISTMKFFRGEGGPITDMHHVYILRSIKSQEKLYIGITTDIERRLCEHANIAKSQYSYRSRYSPWKLETYITFKNQSLAKKCEAYLKTGSGRTFIRRHLI